MPGMAKQRHFASPNADSDFSQIGTEDSDVKMSHSHSLSHSYSGRKPISSWVVFVGLTALMLMIFVFNVFQFEFVSSLYLIGPMNSTNGNKHTREPEHYCEYKGGPVFYNLKTSLGVSYEGSHW